MVNPDKLASVGTCFGKFTKSGKFRLHITALYHLAPYVQVIIMNIIFITILISLYSSLNIVSTFITSIHQFIYKHY